MRVHGAAGARERFLAPLYAHLDRYGLDHISEVADGEAPHTPGGTPFQAWSLAELLPSKSCSACRERDAGGTSPNRVKLQVLLAANEETSMPKSRPVNQIDTVEGSRLHSADCARWQHGGPYLSERQWGTVREDYSEFGTAWEYLPHDHARSRAYRWGEDGLAGFGNSSLNWCVSLALWNGCDPILKERLFGLTNQEGNHGEDVKELYFYVDGTPTHSWMRMLYKYPHRAFLYADLVDENARRSADLPEYEVLDTGVFDDGRYFDVLVDYAKHTPDDILMRVTIENRGDVAAALDVLPQIWARNTWS